MDAASAKLIGAGLAVIGMGVVGIGLGLIFNAWLHALEDRHGRRRDVPRFSDRTLDVDIVLYDDLVRQGEGHLDIPRKELRHAFVLKPIADIAPQLKHPVSGRTMASLWSAFPADSEPLIVEPL